MWNKHGINISHLMAMNFIVYVWEGLVQRGRAHKRGPQNPEN
jgi:hypothetical protein